MYGFFGYNQINILPSDQHKTTFIFPWGTFSYRNIPFGLKNIGATFKREINCAFHDIKHIVQRYFDDLNPHWKHRVDHLIHIRAIFLHCWHYNIRLNPHICVFSVWSSRFCSFVVSKHGIRIDSLKVQEILYMYAPFSLF